jgi:hypothetical protein
MVQNWENFMDPGGGAYDTSFATGGASILAGFGIDLAARTWVNKYTKVSTADKKGLAKRFYGVGLGKPGGPIKVTISSAFGMTDGGYSMGTRRTTSTGIFVGSGTAGPSTNQKFYPSGKQGGVAMKGDFNKYIKDTEGRLSKKYGGTKTLLKGLSWTLLATGAMMMMEGATTPGTVSRAAMLSDQKAMGMTQGPMDSQQAYTQRQRALMAIHDSQLGIRNVIGNEAGHLHR